MTALYLSFAARSDVGRVRKDNQDSAYVGPHLLVVADGVGGAARGDIASSACVEAIRKLDVPPGNDSLSELAATIHLAHDRLAEIVEAHPDLDGTSTTVTAAVFDGTHLQLGHVGDSRGYLLRDGVLEQLTTDHTLVQSLVDEGRITEEEARVHPHRNLILRAVDGVHEPEPDLFAVEVRAGDRLLFCSDGCAGVLDNTQLGELLVGESLEDVAARLITTSLDAGSSDNVTVVVAELVESDTDLTATSGQVVGAAASAPHLRIADDSTGNLAEPDSQALASEDDDESDLDPEAIRYAPQPPRRGTFLRVLAVLVVVLALLGGAGWGAYAYSQSNYYVADVGGTVVIYQGVDLDLGIGPALHHRKKTTALKVADLSEYVRGQIHNNKSFDDYATATTYVERVLQETCKGDDAVASESATPAAKPKKRRASAAASPKATPTARSTAGATPRPSLTASPTRSATLSSTPTAAPQPPTCAEAP
ncbi:MAG: serine/threonine-protein phosphatase [Marmoricola sp.]|nr:serine/threonine-protein phosphatase [Marmoricola sp.]